MATFLVVVISGVDMDTSYHEVEADNAKSAEFFVFYNLGCPDYFDTIEVECVKGTPVVEVSDYFEDSEEIYYCPPDEENYDIPF